MILQGKKKAVFKQSVGYFINNTGLSHMDFINYISNPVTEDYNSWLSHEIFKLCQVNGITMKIKHGLML